MKLEKQVTSLELAKKLKELGVEQESQFWWLDGKERGYFPHYGSTFVDFGGEVRKPICSAFTVAELGEMLPQYFSTHRTVGQPETWTCNNVLDGVGEYDSFWGDTPEKYPWKNWVDENEANARAKMLIYLLENNLLETK